MKLVTWYCYKNICNNAKLYRYFFRIFNQYIQKYVFQFSFELIFFSNTAFTRITPRCSVKNVFLKFLQIHRKTPVSESLFLIKLQNFSLQLCFKKAFTHVFFCEFCKNFKNTYFVKHMHVAASVFLESDLILIKLLFISNSFRININWINLS